VRLEKGGVGPEERRGVYECGAWHDLTGDSFLMPVFVSFFKSGRALGISCL